jgi:hypothetical protein
MNITRDSPSDGTTQLLRWLLIAVAAIDTIIGIALFLAPAELLRIGGLPGEAGAIWLALAGGFLACLAMTRVVSFLARPVFVPSLVISIVVQAPLTVYLLLKLTDVNRLLWVLIGVEIVLGLVTIWFLVRIRAAANAL